MPAITSARPTAATKPRNPMSWMASDMTSSSIETAIIVFVQPGSDFSEELPNRRSQSLQIATSRDSSRQSCYSEPRNRIESSPDARPSISCHVVPHSLANFLACRHKTLVDLLAVRGRIQRPDWNDPLAVVLRDRGLEHERRYVDALRAADLRVVDLTRDDDARWSDEDAAAETMNAMRSGADVIVQAPIVGDGWFGYADVLRRVDGLSACGDWHYEVHDTKLSRETRGGTILQLCVYTDVLSRLQSREPEYFRVVTPAGIEAYRLDDFGAFYRLVVREYRAFLEARSLDEPTPPSIRTDRSL